MDYNLRKCAWLFLFGVNFNLHSMHTEVAAVSDGLSSEEKEFLLHFDGTVPGDKQSVVDHLLSKVSLQQKWDDIGVLRGHGDGITALAFSSDGKQLASGASDGVICLWDAGTGMRCAGSDRWNERPILHAEKAVTALAFSPDGRTLASGTSDGLICLWDVGTGMRYAASDARKDDIRIASLVFTPDGACLASEERCRFTYCSSIAYYFLWHLVGAKVVRGGAKVWHFSESRDEDICLRNDHRGEEIRLFSSKNWGEISELPMSVEATWLCRCSSVVHRTLTLPSFVNLIAFNADGSVLATGCSDSVVRLWDIATEKTIDLRGLADRRNLCGIVSLALSADGGMLAAGSGDQAIRIWGHTSLEKQLFVLKKRYGLEPVQQSDLPMTDEQYWREREAFFDEHKAELFQTAALKRPREEGDVEPRAGKKAKTRQSDLAGVSVAVPAHEEQGLDAELRADSIACKRQKLLQAAIARDDKELLACLKNE